MRGALLLLPLLLSACGSGDGDTHSNAAVDPERLEKLANGMTGEEPPPRLGLVQRRDVTPEFEVLRPVCRLSRRGKLILIVNARGAVARIDGRRALLAVSGPVGPTGGFFTGPRVTLSVGRIAPVVAEAEAYAGGWPATATLGGDPDREIEKIDATWGCAR